MMRKITKKEEGMADIVISLAMVVMILITMYLVVHMRQLTLTKNNMDDGLTTATLSAIIVDKELYSHTGISKIDTSRCYDVFIKVLKDNLKLDNDMNAKNPVYYKSISVDSFVVYNVSGNDVEIVRFDETGSSVVESCENGLGSVKAENGKIIKESSIYIKITTEIKTFMSENTRSVSTSNLIGVELNED